MEPNDGGEQTVGGKLYSFSARHCWKTVELSLTELEKSSRKAD